MFEIIVLGLLSALTVVVVVLYSKRIDEAHRRYLEAKAVIDDIILSFNKDLQTQEDRLEASVRKINALSSRDEHTTEKLEAQKKETQVLAGRVEALPNLEKTLPRIDALENRLNEVVSAKDDLLQKITVLEKQRFRQREYDGRIESAIPIKREKVLAPLTETELAVLEFLAAEGEKTAPEIREHIRLSREHTARLMKKLYEKGYLERSSNRTPFTYRLKDEMQKILRKPEQKTD